MRPQSVTMLTDILAQITKYSKQNYGLDLPGFFHYRGPPANCMDLVPWSHDSHPPETGDTAMTAIKKWAS